MKLLEPQHTSALILGTGGSSRAVAYGLKKMGIDFSYVSRKGSGIDYADLNPEIMAHHKLIINCTPVGMFPEITNCPEIPYEMLTAAHLLFDLIYNPEETLFLRKGKQQGAQTSNGLEMLQLQAERSWEIWNL